MKYKIQYSCVCHKGNRRPYNQDNFICNEVYLTPETREEPIAFSGSVLSTTPTLFGVFDGMGGEAYGETASYFAASEAERSEIGKNEVNDIHAMCFNINNKICEYAEENSLGTMGTTAAMLYFGKKDIILCNIGDSKVYSFMDGNLTQISYDHAIPMPDGMKASLSQYLGMPPSDGILDPFFSRGVYNVGDMFLICSDGLSDMVDADSIKNVLTNAPFENATDILLNKALMNGGRDNITILLFKITK